jgi:hypothetical protein
VLLAKALGCSQESVRFPEKFGDVTNDDDYVLDMRPCDTFSKICIDHHEGHLASPRYTLVWNVVPTSVIVFDKFRAQIPQEEWWKTVVGAVGDGRAADVPPIIWKRFPELLEKVDFIYGNLKTIYPSFKYQLLSAPVNAVCRVGNPLSAFRALYDAKTWDDILTNPVLIEAQELTTKEVNRIISEASERGNWPREIGPFTVWVYASKYAIGGILAIKLHETTNPNQTVIAINEVSRSGSVRGDLASLVVSELNENGFQAGGHHGFSGVTIPRDKTVRELEDVLRNIWRRAR